MQCAVATSFGQTSSLVKGLGDPTCREDDEVLPLEFDVHVRVLDQFPHLHLLMLRAHIPSSQNVELILLVVWDLVLQANLQYYSLYQSLVSFLQG